MSVLPGIMDLLDKDGEELDQLFRSVPAGPVPDGDGAGTVLILSGSRTGKALARAARLAVWQGKVFDRESGDLRNKVTPLRIRAIRATVAPGPSRVDGKECIVLDYSHTSLVARWVRDEIRMVGSGQYLGVVFLRGRRVAGFGLVFDTPDPQAR
ncbi:hypothetical protein [Actinomadura rudentiformis]|nr:hypothetical protein [Actinomadura rudentiformis]